MRTREIKGDIKHHSLFNLEQVTSKVRFENVSICGVEMEIEKKENKDGGCVLFVMLQSIYDLNQMKLIIRAKHESQLPQL